MQKLERCVLFILLLLASGAGQSFFGDKTRSTTAAGEEGLQLAFGLLYLILSLLLIFRFRTQALLVIQKDKWIAILCSWAIASSLWSADPAESFRRALALVGTSMAGLYLQLRHEPAEQLEIIASVIGAGAVASLLVCLFLPGIGLTSDGCWAGVYLIKNSAGRIMAMGALCFALLALRERRGRATRLTLFLLCCGLLVLSRSATALVVTVIMLAVLPSRKLLNLRSRRLVAVTAILTPFLAIIALAAADSWDEILFALGRTPSLSGRIPLWQLVWGEVASKPFLGYGFTAFWTSWEGRRVSETVAWDVAVPHAHNGFLEVWLGLGVVGLGMLLINLTRNMRIALRVARWNSSAEYTWPMFLLIFTILYNLTENSMLGVNSLPWIAYTAVSFWLARNAGKQASERTLEEEPVLAFEPRLL